MSGVQCGFDSQFISCFMRRLELILIICSCFIEPRFIMAFFRDVQLSLSQAFWPKLLIAANGVDRNVT